MKAKKYKKKGSQFLETLKSDVEEAVDQNLMAGPEEMKGALVEMAISKCKQSFRNGVDAGRKTRKREKSRQ